jgi:hypothetical protein
MKITCNCGLTTMIPMMIGGALVGAIPNLPGIMTFGMEHVGAETHADWIVFTLECSCGAELQTGPDVSGDPEEQWKQVVSFIHEHVVHEGD